MTEKCYRQQGTTEEFALGGISFIWNIRNSGGGNIRKLCQKLSQKNQGTEQPVERRCNIK